MRLYVLFVVFEMCLLLIDAKPVSKALTKRDKDNSVIIIIGGERSDADRGDAEHGDRDHADREDGEHGDRDRDDVDDDDSDRADSDAPKHKLSRSHGHEDSDHGDDVSSQRCCRRCG